MSNDDQILDINLNDNEKENAPESLILEAIEPKKFVILSVLTLGAYDAWWMYKCWRFFKEKDGLDIWPVARVIFSIFFFHALLDRIQKYAHSTSYPETYPITLLFIIYLFLNLLSRLPDPFWLITIFSVGALIPAVKAFGFALKNGAVNYAKKETKYNNKQIGLVVFGIIFWILIIAGLFIPAESL